MLWTMGEDGTLVSERDDENRCGVLYTGKRVTNTQARQGYEPYPYYGLVTARDELPSPTTFDGGVIAAWGTLEQVLDGVEDRLAKFRGE